MERRRVQSAWTFIALVWAMGLGAVAIAAGFDSTADRPFVLGWIAMAVAFAAAECYSVTLEVRREAHSLTFSEVPLTIGLVFADPTALIIGKVVGSAIGLALVRRPPLIKFVFNVGQFAVEAGTALIVFNLILGTENPVEPRGWLAALAGISVAHLIGWVLVSNVMRIVGAPVTVRSALAVLGVSGSAALAECAVALGAAGALWRNAWSWTLLVIIGAALGYFFLAYVRIRDRHQALATLHTFTTSLSVEDSRDLAKTVLLGIADILRAQRVVLVLPIDGGVNRIELRGDRVEFEEDRAGTAASLNLVTTVGGGNQRLHSSGGDRVIGGVKLNSPDVIAVPFPMPDRDGLVIVDGRLSDARGFDDEDVQLLETAVGHAATALHNARLVDKLREEASFRAHQALHDDVTDLPNQRALLEQLDGQLALGTRLVMLTARIHSLREVNETLGRAMGDEMLRQVAARLRPIGRRSWCARSGTDEFTLVVPGGLDESDDLALRLVEAFDQPVLCNDVALAVTVGVGVALAPQHGTEAEMLLRRASLAASRSALDGTTVTTWASDRDPYDPQRLTIAADLRDAIPDGELEVHFQPQLDLATGMIISAEALVRWNHPRLGYLRPDQFIAAAENTGAIDALTYHVLEVATTAGARWHELGWGLDIGVNLSARNLTSTHFVEQVAAILESTGFPAPSLTFELTESSVMTEAERALNTLDALHALGIAISIDDFGTGYSSLAHLRRLPVGEIKIDKSFVFDLTTSESDEAIVRSMVDLGHNLGLTVVVEGVETVEVRDRLRELGSDRLQGYLLSRPLSAEAFETWVSERPVRPVHPAHIGRVVNLDRRR